MQVKNDMLYLKLVGSVEKIRLNCEVLVRFVKTAAMHAGNCEQYKVGNDMVAETVAERQGVTKEDS